tara:strand:+ start:6288 stop:7910 length:1623 start_codon:yes stop_codon:yes gene_type:complete
LILDLAFYQKNILKLVTKGGELKSFNPNSYQQELNKAASSKGMQRILVLKCRQIGVSTWGASYVYHKTATQFNKNALIIADDDENSSGLFRMTKLFYENSAPLVRPMQRYSNEKAIEFNHPDKTNNNGLNSKISVTTAGKLSAGRSKTIQYLHCSEFAYWPNAALVSTGLFQSVPLMDNTSILIESTANGVGGKGAQFYEMCMRAIDGDSAYKFFFFDWKENPEYEIEPGEDFKLDDEEKDLAEKYPNLTLRKLAFRRYKIRNEMGSTILDPRDQYMQEYPDSPVSAFIASGRPCFNTGQIHKDIERAKDGERYTYAAGGFKADSRGEFHVFKKPENKAYSIGADVAEGLETGDFSTACVIDKNLEVCCTYSGHIDPDQFGEILVRLAKWFNGAIITHEVNNHGHAVSSALKRLAYNKVWKRETLDELGREIQDKIGWNTNVKTKMLMLDELVAPYRDGLLKVNCKPTLREMLTVMIEDGGNVVLNGKDRTVALGLAIQGLKQASIENSLKAFTPNKMQTKDVTKMSIEEKMAYYKRMDK